MVKGQWAPPPTGGKGINGRAAVSGAGPIGAAGCRQQRNQASCRTRPLLSGWLILYGGGGVRGPQKSVCA